MIGLLRSLSLLDSLRSGPCQADDRADNWARANAVPLYRTGLVSSVVSVCLFGVGDVRANNIEVLDLKTRVVTATAYNSVRAQTDDTPNLTAWGYTLKPGMKVVAVSSDLIKRGLTHGAWVVIDGIPGVFRVLDKMASRWRNRIDIYMGRDIKAARRWGRQKVRIWYEDHSKQGLMKIKERLKLRAVKARDEAARTDLELAER